MPTANQSTSAKTLSPTINRVLYGSFVLLSLYFFLTKSYEDAVINLGIALIFDPFDQTVRWDMRPVWQRVWLIAHLVIMVAVGVIYWKTFGS